MIIDTSKGTLRLFDTKRWLKGDMKKCKKKEKKKEKSGERAV